MSLTPEWLDGFEHKTLSVAGTGLYNTITASRVTIQTSNGRAESGAAWAQCDATASAAAQITKNLAVPSNKECVRFAFKIVTPPSAGNFLTVFMFTRSSAIASLRVSSGGVLSASLDGSNWTNGPTLNSGSWYCVELRYNTSANPWVLDWKVGNSPQTQVTRATTAGTISVFTLGTIATGGPAGTVGFDDFIYGSFTDGTEWWGDGAIIGYAITADGAHSVGSATFRFTANNGSNYTTMTNSTATSWGTLDDWPVTADANAADDWVEKSGGTGADYVEEAFAGNSQTKPINAVMGVCAIRNDSGTQTNNCQLTLNDGGSEHGTALFNATIGSATTIYKSAMWPTRAAGAGGGAWDASSVGALKMRFRSSDIAPVPRVKALLIQVDWQTSLSFSMSMAGGAEAAGTASLTFGYTEPASGGATSGGDGIPIFGYTESVGGGGVFGGEAGYTFDFSVPLDFSMSMTGGAAAGGSGLFIPGYTYSMAGGGVSGGSGPYSVGYTLSMAGGAVSGGAADQGARGFSFAGSGGAAAAGSASYANGYIFAGSGGAVAGGAFGQGTIGYLFSMAGGAEAAGTADTSGSAFNWSYTYSMAGGVVSGGAADQGARGFLFAGSGGAAAAGSASYANGYIFAGSGGAVAGGAFGQGTVDYLFSMAGGVEAAGTADISGSAFSWSYTYLMSGGALTSGEAIHQTDFIFYGVGGAIFGGAFDEGMRSFIFIGDGGASSGGTAPYVADRLILEPFIAAVSTSQPPQLLSGSGAALPRW